MFKRYFVITLGILLISSNSFALDPSSKETIAEKTKIDLGYKNSLDLGYAPSGLSPLSLALYGTIAGIDQLIPFSSLFFGAEVQNLSSTGTFSVNYMRKLNKWLWVGGNISYESAKVYLLDYYYIPGLEYTSRISCLPIMAVCKAAWLRKKHISLYSKIGIGANSIFTEGKCEKINLAVQLTPIGFEFGGKHVFGFLEGGVGLQGTLIGGVRYMF